MEEQGFPTTYFHRRIQVPKMEGFLNLVNAILGVCFPLHKPYPNTAYIGEASSILGTLNVL